MAASLAWPAIALASNCAGTSTGLVPITDLGAGLYQGYAGGLYPGGTNVRPASHDAAGIAIAGAIAPLDTFGVADPNGRIVLVSIGMSNCTQEFTTFLPIGAADPYRNPRVWAIDCAVGGQTAAILVNPAAAYWDTVRTRLRGRGASPAQVQVVWLKEADANPVSGFPAATQTLSRELGTIVRYLKTIFPNVKLCYLSSRTYAGYASSTLNPEPYAYESAFAVKWIIETQIAGEDSLNYDPSQGPSVVAPWLAWGPYLWADGLNPRGGDGLTWQCADFITNDGTHPSPSGRTKVANMLLDFFHNDGTARIWYEKAATAVAPIAPAPRLQLAVAPNPAPDGVAITFAVPTGQRWRLDVVDLSGRRVRELGAGIGDGVTTTILWAARAMRPGVYWVRLSNGSTSVVRRLAVTGAR